MNTVHQVVAFLEGKKTLILSISALVISFLVTDGTIKATLGTLLQSIISLLAGGAVAVASTSAYQQSAPAQVVNSNTTTKTP